MKIKKERKHKEEMVIYQKQLTDKYLEFFKTVLKIKIKILFIFGTINAFEIK